MQTLKFIIGLFFFGLGYEFYTLVTEAKTISEVFSELGREWNPFVAYSISVLNAHFFLVPRWNVAETIPEGAEVYLCIFGGWAIFWYFVTTPERLPLPTWAMASIILFGHLMGAFVWTIEHAPK